jgi:hypothetical protein
MLIAMGEYREHSLEIIMAESSNVGVNRTQLTISASQCKADAILWLDCDHTFPPDALLRLIAHDKPVVGVNYPRRSDPAKSTATRKRPDGEYEYVYTTEALAGANRLEQVASLGLGLCLVKLEPIGRIQWPLFAQEMNGPRLKLGEDVYFFRKLEAAGVPVFLDHALSWQVGHIATHIVTNADTEALRTG